MSLGHGASVVRDGLVLHLDAANVKSYPGTGTIWSDLSGNGNDSVLTNGPQYVPNDNGALSFDGSNDYATLSYDESMNNAHTTLSVWIKSNFVTGPNNRHYVFDGLSHRTMIFINEPNEINFVVTAGSTPYAIYNNPVTSEDSWCNIVGTYDGSNAKLYFNGNLVATTASTGDIVNATGAGRLMDYIGGGYNTQGLASNFMMYNRGITEAEVKQNFEATRSRYGI